MEKEHRLKRRWITKTKSIYDNTEGKGRQKQRQKDKATLNIRERGRMKKKKSILMKELT